MISGRYEYKVTVVGAGSYNYLLVIKSLVRVDPHSVCRELNLN